VVLRALGNGGERGVDRIGETNPEPTVEEIVVALRDMAERRNRRDAAPLRYVGAIVEPVTTHRRSERFDFLDPRANDDEPVAVEFKNVAVPDIAEMRAAEIERLLGENRRLHEQVFHLLHLVEQERQALRADEADRGATKDSRAAIVREVRGTIEAEMRPLLKAILRLLERTGAERGGQALGNASAGELPARLGRPRLGIAVERQPDRADASGEDWRRRDVAPRPDMRGDPLGRGTSAATGSTAARPIDAGDAQKSARAAPDTRSERDRHAAWILDLIEAAGARVQMPGERDGSSVPHGAEPHHHASFDPAASPPPAREYGLVARFVRRLKRFRRASE
jgi:hypothetical protein